MTEAMRANEGKSRLDLFLAFDNALSAVADVLGQGAVKYEEDNWLLGGKPDGEYLASAMRHILAFRSGEVYDPDIGTMHIANAAWNLLALIRLNYRDIPTINPGFDQAAFLARYGEGASPSPVSSIKEGDRVEGQRPGGQWASGVVLDIDEDDLSMMYEIRAENGGIYWLNEDAVKL